MTLTLNEIARALLSRPGRGSHLIGQADAQNMLGEDGYHAAMQKGWLIPDPEFGYIGVSERVDARREMEALAEDYTNRKFRNGTKMIVGVQNDAFGKPVSFLVKDANQGNNPQAPQTTMMLAALLPQDKTELGIA